MADTFTLEINGVDYTETLILESVNIDEVLQARGFTLSCDIIIQNQDYDKPSAGHVIIFYRNAIREFAGRIASYNEVQIGTPGNLQYSLRCVDFTVDFDTELIDHDFDSQLAGEMVRELVGIVGKGFTSTNVEDGINLNELKVDYQLPSATLQRIAESIEFQWYIDYYRDVHYFYLLDRPAPIPAIYVDTDALTYRDLEILEQWDQVKNRIILTGAKAKSSNQDSLAPVGDGTQKFFPLNFEPWDPNSISVSVDGVPQELLLDNIDGQAGDGQGSAGQVYVCYDNWGVRFPDNYPPGDTAVVAISYNYSYDATVIVEDPVSIAFMKALENSVDAPSNGVHELRFEVPEIRVDSEDSLFEYGQLILLRYSQILYVATFESDVYGWRPGQNFQLVSAAGARDFDSVMYVRRVSKRIRRVDEESAEMTYSIEAASIPFPS